MKVVMIKLSLVCVSLIISLLFVAQSFAKIDPQTIAGVWLFDEGNGDITRDSSGQGNDGKLILNPEWAEGKLGKALEFHGTDYVEISHSKSLDITEIRVVKAPAFNRGDETLHFVQG